MPASPTKTQTLPVMRLQLLRHAPTAATRAGRFAADEELDPSGSAAAAALAPVFAAAMPDAVFTSPARRCRQTAVAAGLQAKVEPALAECSFGTWEGRGFAEIAADEGSLSEDWLSDPDAAPHGGESLRRFSARVASCLEELAVRAQPGQRVLAVTHAGVIRAAAVHALRAPLDAFWRLTADPLTLTELAHAGDGWSVSCLNAHPCLPADGAVAA